MDQERQVVIGEGRLNWLINRSNALRMSRVMTCAMLGFIIALCFVAFYQRGAIHEYQRRISELQAEKDRKPLAPGGLRPIYIQPC